MGIHAFAKSCLTERGLNIRLTTLLHAQAVRENVLRTFALIVSAHPYCARNSLRDVMPRHALSARAVEEMWRYKRYWAFNIYARA